MAGAAIHRQESLELPAGGETLAGDLVVPPDALGLVLFAHGSVSGRRSPRNRKVASALQDAGFATLLFDLLTPAEERRDAATAEYRFDIGLLAGRLEDAARWIIGRPPVADLRAGFFGASTGAAAALIAAAALPGLIAAVVSRGGRPDLAGSALAEVRAPTLLIVGGADGTVVDLNRQAYRELAVAKSLAIVPGATHLFPEPGALETVSDLAARWFATHLAPR